MAPRPGFGWALAWSGDISWHVRAACRGLANAPGYWFAVPAGREVVRNVTKLPQVHNALELCWDACPVRELCWHQAAVDQQAEGVWGGVYWPAKRASRRQIVERGPRARPDYRNSSARRSNALRAETGMPSM